MYHEIRISVMHEGEAHTDRERIGQELSLLQDARREGGSQTAGKPEEDNDMAYCSNT